MGYIDITIGGSDAAADAHADIRVPFEKAAAKAIKSLRRELKDVHNCFNTPGPVNVAMILTESKIDFPLRLSREYPDLLEETHTALKEYINKCYDPDLWDDLGNREWHLERYRKLLRKIRDKKNKVLAEIETDEDYFYCY